MKLLFRMFLIILLIAGLVVSYRYYRMAQKRKFAAMSDAQKGLILIAQKGCGSCHRAGDSFIAPPLEGLWMLERTFVDGSKALADRSYLIHSIREPRARIVKGYQGSMPSYAAQLSGQEISWIVAAIRSLTSVTQPSDP